MKNTSAGIEGHCYKKPTRILPAMVWLLVEACVSDKEEVPSWVTVQQNITGVLPQMKVY
jgi:hypothetical protein